jgi:hypothetical protein
MGGRLLVQKNVYLAALKPRKVGCRGRQTRHPIDRFVDAYLAKNKLAFPDAADDVAFFARLS